MFKNLFICFSFLLFAGAQSAIAEKTTLHLCNENADRKVFVSHLRQAGGGSGWQSVGWFGVEKGTCRDVEMGTYTGKVYVYADDEYHETSWGEGEVQFCVNRTSAFTINNADTIACTDSNVKRVKSDEYTVTGGVNNITFRPNFATVKYCNQNQTYPLYASFAKKTQSGWQSKGWFMVDKNSCTTTTVGKYVGELQVYAEFNGGEVSYGSGPMSYCVNRSNAFLIDSAQDAGNCSGPNFKMALSDAYDIQSGENEITFAPVPLKTLLKLCNKTTDKEIQASFGVDGQDSKHTNKGWVHLSPGACQEIDLGEYLGKAYIYGEANQGDDYWGSGPINLCVNKTKDFVFEDSSNGFWCSSDIKQKMVPTTGFDLIQGLNTFSFQP